jgi:hypothetical protein
LSTRRALRWGTGLLLAASPLGSQVTGGGSAPPRAWAHVTYLTLSSAYVDAGTAEGLVEGGRLEVMRGDSIIAVLQARFVATHKAACEIVSAAVRLAVGDTARFVPVSGARDTMLVVVERPTRSPASSDRAGAIRGRVGLYYLTVQQLDGSGAVFTQPSGDIRLSGSRLGGSGVGLTADVRGRRVTQTRADGLGTDVRNQTRVYQAALSWSAPGSPLRLALGRQFAPGIPPVGLVDGVSARLDFRGWSGGVFAGTQPEPVNLGFSGAITEVGASLERHSRAADPARWSLVTGLSGSYEHGAANREFLYLQAQYATSRVSLYAAHELDYYRASRRVGGERAISPTSSFASVQLHLSDMFSLTAGVDNRRNVRLYRDVVNPETVFDDAFRRGVWAGVSTRLGERVRATIDARVNRGGATGPVDSYTLFVSATPSAPVGLSLRSRSTRFVTTTRAGWLQSLALGVSPWSGGDLALSGGARLERDRGAGTTTSLRWVSADLDVSLARTWYLLVSAYREWGGFEAHALVYGGLSYRF